MNQYYIKRYIDSAVKREIRHYRMHQDQDGMLDSLKAKLKVLANKLKETISRFRANKKVAKIATIILQIVSLIIGAQSVSELYSDTKELNEKLKILKMIIIKSKLSSNSEMGEMGSAAESTKSNLIFRYRVNTILNSLVMIGSLLGAYLGQKINKSI